MVQFLVAPDERKSRDPGSRALAPDRYVIPSISACKSDTC